MLAVAPAFSAALAAALGRLPQCRPGENLVDRRVELCAQARRVDAEARGGDLAVEIVGLDQLRDMGPEVVERGLRLVPALVRAVAEADHPFAGVAQMISHLARRAGRDSGGLGIVRAGEPLIERRGVGGEEEMARHGVGEIAVRLLDDQRVAVVRLGPPEGERRLVAPVALELAGARIEGARLADQVEAKIRHCDVFLERRRARQPFAHPVAEHERRIAEAGEPGRAGIGETLHSLPPCGGGPPAGSLFSAKRGRCPEGADGVWKAGMAGRKFAVTVVQCDLRRSSGPHPIRRCAPPSPASWGRGGRPPPFSGQ